MVTTVKDIYDLIDSIAPFRLQESWDNSGILIGNASQEIERVTVALDVTQDVSRETFSGLIITHHPVIFRPIKRINTDTDTVIGMLLKNGVSVISAHTNFDSAVMNKILCEKLGLEAVQPIAVENGAPMGCICETDEISASELAAVIKNSLGNKVVRYNDCGKKLRRIAVCSGSGGSFLGEVLSKGCDAFITGDVKHDIFIDSYNAGLTVFDAGHFHTENIFCEYVRDAIAEKFPGLEVVIADSNRDILSYEM